MPSYLLKNRNGNYYTRIPFPQSLRLLGCPQEIRVSLLTKDRSEATLRNLVAAHGIKLLMSKLATYPASILNPDNHPSKTCFRDLIAPELTRLRQQLLSSDDALTMPAQDPAKRPDDVSPPAPGCHDTMCKSITTELVQPQLAPHQLLNNVVTVPRTMRQLQTEFLRRKTGENISLRSLQQLQTRTTALILAVGGDFFVQALRFKQVDLFVQSLSTDKRLKAKTICEYKVACAQMLNFAVKLEYIAKNPFDQIKVKNSRSTPRQRWERSQLKTLFSSENFTQHAYDNADDFWIMYRTLSGKRINNTV